MGGKVAKPVIDPITVKGLLGANIELFVAEFSRLAALSQASTTQNRGLISKSVFYAHFLEPKLGEHFSSSLIDRVYAVSCPANALQGPVTEDEFLVLYYLCYHAGDAMLMKFIFNLCDTSASDVVSMKDMEKFLIQLYIPPTSATTVSSQGTRVTPVEEKEPLLKSLAALLAETTQATEATKTAGELTFSEWREVFEGDYRVRTLAQCLRRSPEPAVQRIAAEQIIVRSQEAAGMTVPHIHIPGYFIDRPVPDEPQVSVE